MKESQLTKWSGWLLLVVFGLIVLHAPLTVFVGSHFADLSLLIKAWKEIIIFVVAMLLAIEISRQHKWRELSHDNLMRLVLIYVIIHIASLEMSSSWLSALAGLAIDLRYVAYFVIVYTLIKMAPRYTHLFKKIAVVGALIVIGFGTLQIILPADFLAHIGYSDSTIQPYLTIDKNSAFVRLQSTLRGPNPYGAYAASVAILALAWLSVKRKFNWKVALLGILAVVGTYLSYARSAYLALVVGIVIVIAARYWKRVKIWQWISLAAAGIVIIVVGTMLSSNSFVSNVVLHEDPQEGGHINSNDDHWKSLVQGVQNVISRPFGDGIGSTGSASLLSNNPQIIENQYLLVAHEVGWFGLALFLMIFAVIMRRLWRFRKDAWALGIFASGVGLAIVGLMLPVWVDDTVSMIWWGLAALTIAHE